MYIFDDYAIDTVGPLKHKLMRKAHAVDAIRYIDITTMLETCFCNWQPSLLDAPC